MKNQNEILLMFYNFFLEKPPRVEEKNKAIFVSLGVVFGIGLFLHSLLLPFFWIIEVYPLALFNCLSVSLFFSTIILNRMGFHLVASILATIELFSHQALSVIFLGWAAGFQYYIFLIPVAIFVSSSRNNFIKIMIAVITISEFLLLDYFFKTAEPLFRLSITISIC